MKDFLAATGSQIGLDITNYPYSSKMLIHISTVFYDWWRWGSFMSASWSLLIFCVICAHVTMSGLGSFLVLDSPIFSRFSLLVECLLPMPDPCNIAGMVTSRWSEVSGLHSYNYLLYFEMLTMVLILTTFLNVMHPFPQLFPHF